MYDTPFCLSIQKFVPAKDVLRDSIPSRRYHIGYETLFISCYANRSFNKQSRCLNQRLSTRTIFVGVGTGCGGHRGYYQYCLRDRRPSSWFGATYSTLQYPGTKTIFLHMGNIFISYSTVMSGVRASRRSTPNNGSLHHRCQGIL